MNTYQFTRMVCDPIRTRSELEQVRKNALAAQNNDFVAIAEHELNRRFPGWRWERPRTNHCTPVRVTFKGTVRSFPLSNSAYIWLVEQFIEIVPELFQQVTKYTIFVAKGRDRNYFGKTPAALFRRSPHLANDKNFYAQLSNGWYINLDLDNKQKNSTLGRIAYVANLKFGNDWDWEEIRNLPAAT